MKVTVESFPGVVCISIEVKSKEGNPLVLNWNRWPDRIPHLHNFVEHVPDERGCECQYLDGLCYPRDVWPALGLMDACRDAQTVLGFTPDEISLGLLRRHVAKPISFIMAEDLRLEFEKFMAMEVEPE